MTQVSHQVGERSETGAKIASAWDDVLQLLQPVLLLIVFAIAVFLRRETAHQLWPESWNAVFVSLGMLCLGFGAGMLFYRRRQQADTAALRDEYAELSARAQRLTTEMDEYIKRKQASGSS